jgi:3-oxoacyl-(acyl-carrier-protein) synthase/NAD(P)-dependent dehydrogenase (short-subunit alcohol dehydrogenase family)/acyl carrier protein
MAHIRVDDKGKMAAIFGPYEKIGELLKQVKGYVEIANINSNGQSVIGGATQPVLEAMELCKDAGFHVAELNVSHAFHTQIVASVSGPLKNVLDSMPVQPPSLPVIANVTGDFYPSGNDAKPQITDLLSRQVASPVQFVQGVKRLYDAGVRVFVEMGPKKALNGFVKDILSDSEDWFNLFTNMPKIADAESFNQALCGMYAAGHGRAKPAAVPALTPEVVVQQPVVYQPDPVVPPAPAAVFKAPSGGDQYEKLGRLFVDFMDKAKDVFYDGGAAPAKTREVWITGASLGLPGVDGVFQDSNVARILNGDQFILPISQRFREAMVDKNILRLVKSDKGGPRFESIGQIEEVVKLAGQKLNLDLMRDFDFPEERIQGLDVVTMLAIGAGLDAMRDAGVPLVMNYRTTSTGSSLPHRWMLPEKLRDETGIIFASAFPGYNAYADEIRRYQEDLNRKKQIELLSDIRKKLVSAGDTSGLVKQVDEQIAALEQERKDHPYVFDRHFLFRVLGMGHSQFAEYIGARGPNIHINAACSSGTMGLGLAKTWIETGQCRRVIVISADDITGEDTLDWFVSGFLAVGAAATDERIEDAALPFDRRRHGLIVGMGAAAVVVESGDAARERGLSPICEILGSVSANSAFHGSRLDVSHIKDVMEDMVGQAEKDWGIDRRQIAGETVFISHETYTPARGGSASAEVHALRHVFKESADKIVIANTKGYTGHPMAVGIEDVVGIKILETGIVPPVANVKEIDPEFGSLNLSKGGSYPVRYGLRLAAGFGSQISMCLLRWIPTPDGRRRSPSELGYAYRIADQEKWNQWLREITGKPAAKLEVYKRNLRIAEPDLHPGFATSNGNGKQVVEEPAIADNAVQSAILDLIAAKTGYPPDMLDPDLDLEADLGIDTVKQAELFAEVRKAYGIERDDTIQLADFPTLKHIVQFVYLKRPDLTAAPQTPPPPPPVQTAKPAGDREQVLETVLQLIAEKTGYPADMLDPDLDLEADLGIDTVKQAELFAEIRGKYGIPRDDSINLAEFPTLNHIVRFVLERRPAAGVVETATAAPVSAPAPNAIMGSLERALEVPRRVPVAMLRPGLELCKPTGAQIREGGTYLLMSDEGGVGKALEKELKKRKANVVVIDPAADREELEKTIEQQPIDGVFWLPSLDVAGPVWEMAHADWKALTHRHVKLLHAAMRAIVRSQEHAPFLLSATRLGGRFGYDEQGALSPIGGAVCGFTKAYKREHPEAVVKVADFPEGGKPAAILQALLGELEYDPGIVEVGYFDEKRWTIGLQEQPWPEEDEGMTLAPDSVFLVTGAAGSIVSAIVADLARVAGGGVFHLLDLAEKPDPSDTDLQLFRKDKESLKRELYARLSAEGKKVTPVMIEKALAGLERKDAALQAIEAIGRAGGKAHYYSVNLLNPAAMSAVMEKVRKESGRIDVLMHAGGLEISQLLPNKTTAEFDLVFDVKADGWYNLMASLTGFPVHRMMVFSSIAGRFGNGGQTDYSAANDFLCKSMSNLKTARPGAVGIALDWTAWDAIGMASRGSIPTVMKQAGIDMLPPEAGIGFLQKALTACSSSTEMVVAQSLGRMLDEFDPGGGADLEKWNAAIRQSGSLMVQEAEAAGLYRGLVLSGAFDPSKQPFLYNHQINGTPVLPGVMGIEAMAEAAQSLAPGWRVAEVFEVAFLSPFKFYRSEPRKVFVQCFLTAEGDEIIGHCKLSGVRRLHGKDEEEVTEHFTGKVRLTRKQEGEALNLGIKPEAKKDGVGAQAIYELYFHGPAYQTIESAWTENGRLLALMAGKLPAGHDPESAPLLAWPRHIETCFQAAGLIEMGRHDRMGLPAAVERVSFLKAPDAKARLFAVVDPQPEGYDVSIVDDSGTACLLVSGYKTSALPGGIDEGKNGVLKKLF